MVQSCVWLLTVCQSLLGVCMSKAQVGLQGLSGMDESTCFGWNSYAQKDLPSLRAEVHRAQAL